jgi:predicted PurR-regulated permease PerM
LFYAATLKAIGLNHGLLIGLASGLISFIPYLGSLSGLVTSLCVVILQFGPDWTMIAAIIGIFFVGQSVADHVLAPNLIGARVKLRFGLKQYAAGAPYPDRSQATNVDHSDP